MKKTILTNVFLMFVIIILAQELSLPYQDKGIPYTRSAKKFALGAIDNSIALFAGSRYAYVFGYKVRLDTKDLLYAEAFLHDSKLYVPQSFASLIAQKDFIPKPIPKGLEILKDRWVYEVPRVAVILPASVDKLTINGKSYFAIADYAKKLNKYVLQTKRGLLLISDNAINYKEGKTILDDAIVTIFDTPEKLMEPDMAMKYIPLLKEQGKWTEHAKATPEQIKTLEDGNEFVWPETPRSEYDLKGFNQSLLGSQVPAPGIYPRLLFSPQDIPMLQKHIQTNKAAQKSMVEIEVLFKNLGGIFLPMTVNYFYSYNLVILVKTYKQMWVAACML